MNAQEQATKLLDLLLKQEYYETMQKDLNKKIYQAKVDLYDAMDSEEVDSISVRGIKFAPKEDRQYALKDTEEGLKWDDSKRFFDWLKSNGNGGVIKSKESVPWNTRAKLLKEWTDDGNPLPPFIKESFTNTIDYTKVAVKRLAHDKE